MRLRHTVSLLAIFAVVLVAAPAFARRRPAAACPGGRFVVQAGELTSAATALGTSVVVSNGDDVEIDGACFPIDGRVRQSKAGTLVVARWTACSGIAGAVRLRALIDPTTCNQMSGTFRMRKAKKGHRFLARRAGVDGGSGGDGGGGGNDDDPGGNGDGDGQGGGGGGGGEECQPPTPDSASECPGEDTFTVIQKRIFAARGCTLAACHGGDAAGGLNLRLLAAHENLVGQLPDNPSAKAAGKLRVVPGNAAASFLSQKLRGSILQGEGSRMPLIGLGLPPDQLALIDAWINACAPETGKVPGAPCLGPERYEATAALPPPPAGYQMVLDGPVLQPGEEQEGCLWIPAPNPTDAYIKRIEVALNPGTHHFAIWRHTAPGTPPLGVWLKDDIACLGSGASLGQAVAGAAQGPYSVGESPPGIAGVLPGGGYYGLNAHYYNEFDVPIQIKVWTNFHPYLEGEPPPAHYVRAIISLDTTFNIRVPPNTQTTIRGRYRNDTGKTHYILGVGGHMHKRGLRFSIWKSDGTKVLDDYDWAHPSYQSYWPPYEFKPGDWFDYECLHDNGVTRPLRLDSAGKPMTVTFGISAEDEMCILSGSYYDD